jgi:DNA-directed RNA polymerase specialized sigma24 family protein
MATLGSRLFFFSLDSVSAPTEDDLVQSMIKRAPYQQTLTECQQCVQNFLEALFAKHRGVRRVQWDHTTTPKPVAQTIARLAQLIAIMRTQVEQDCPIQPESAHRATAVLHNIARGHAIINGRTRLNSENLPLIARIALSSMPKERRAVLEAFAKHAGETLSVSDVSEAASVSEGTARRIMREFDRLQIAHYDQNGMGKASPLTLSSEWDGKDDMWDLIREIATSQKSGDVLKQDKEVNPNAW